ncbi:MAG: hypothetical protein HPY76_11870 [Anaerolineae bacterium]|nr:hypothetical protein [Anaerolineae bacterium]
MRKDIFLLWLFLFALGLRLAVVLAAALAGMGIGLDDMFQYDMLARSLVDGLGYRWYAAPDLKMLEPYVEFDFTSVQYDPRGMLTSFRPPLYPFFLALVYRVSGLGFGRFLAARLAQAFIGAALAPLTVLLARRVFPGNERGARLAGWAIAAYPMLVLFTLGLGTENLFIPLLLLGTLALLWAGRLGGWRRFALAGVLFGLALLTRSVALGALGLAAGWVWFALRRFRQALVFLAAAVLVVTPWVVRNSLLHGHFTWIENALGYQLYVSYHPTSSGTFNPKVSMDLIRILDDDARNWAGMEAVKGFIRDDPGRVFTLALRRLGYFLGLEKRILIYFYGNNLLGYLPPGALLALMAVVMLPFVALALPAAWGATLPWRKEALLVGLVSLGYLLPHLVIISEERFHLALLPFIAIFAAQANTRWREIRRGRRWVLALAALLCLLLVANWGFDLWLDRERLVQIFSPGGNQSHFWY